MNITVKPYINIRAVFVISAPGYRLVVMDIHNITFNAKELLDMFLGDYASPFCKASVFRAFPERTSCHRMFEVDLVNLLRRIW